MKKVNIFGNSRLYKYIQNSGQSVLLIIYGYRYNTKFLNERCFFIDLFIILSSVKQIKSAIKKNRKQNFQNSASFSKQLGREFVFNYR